MRQGGSMVLLCTSARGESMQAEELWLRALPLLKDRLSPRNFESWVKPSRAISIEDSTLFIETPSEFAREWIHRNLLGDFNRAISEVAEGNYTVSFRVAEAGSPAEESVQTSGRSEDIALPGPKYGILIPKYTFDTFVVGNHNRFAHAA
ncbi:MAG TPA: hypothetical protein DD435_15930, partial [Cyanobacteria bacterium UBA8530]|nr:hypothetical protein [Cyanobacteria bacterium UBA8530]